MHARLLLESGDCTPPALDLSPTQPATLGRSRENSVVVRNDLVSRLHAKVYFDDGKWVLRDFGSNGTKVGGVRVNGSVDLADGAVIQIGDTQLRFVVGAPARQPVGIAGLVPLSQTPPPATNKPVSEARATKIQDYPTRNVIEELVGGDPVET